MSVDIKPYLEILRADLNSGNPDLVYSDWKDWVEHKIVSKLGEENAPTALQLYEFMIQHQPPFSWKDLDLIRKTFPDLHFYYQDVLLERIYKEVGSKSDRTALLNALKKAGLTLRDYQFWIGRNLWRFQPPQD